MKLWLGRAREAASARALSAVALEKVMAMYLSALADQVETGQIDANDRRRHRVQQHLAARLREDLERLHLQIRVAIADVADTFRRHMLEDEQSGKRYSRLLESIATEALHGDEPLRERLREILDLVMEALGAQCAAYLAYDAPRTKLVLAAATGDEAVESYATSLDTSSFAAEVAAHDEPIQIVDATSTKLEVPDAMRASGIRALLGVRLPRRRDLLGVMYVGISERREFTSREIERLASLGERLSLHLENARLFAALHDKIESLALERSLREHFVTTLAHDLRGPLSAARLAAELLARQPARLDERRDLALRLDRRGDSLARISVHNSGTPIPAADHAHIFDAFVRARSADASHRERNRARRSRSSYQSTHVPLARIPSAQLRRSIETAPTRGRPNTRSRATVRVRLVEGNPAAPCGCHGFLARGSWRLSFQPPRSFHVKSLVRAVGRSHRGSRERTPTRIAFGWWPARRS